MTEEFNNLHQGVMSGLDYYLKFTKLLNSLFSDPRDDMSRFVMVFSDDLKEEFDLAILHYNMNISCLMVHAQQVERSRVKKKCRDANIARSYDDGYKEGRLQIQDKPRFKKIFSNQLPSKFPKAHDDRVPNPASAKGRGTSPPSKKTTCKKCGENHYGNLLVLIDNCFWCCKSGNKVRELPNV
ncbi:uncharacterized protein [Solanum lycopersicum]|uniref:uncharacterized protein n=1 Tax=Solanum lycopersicum TaxID=4081 RepID=UPI003747E08A